MPMKQRDGIEIITDRKNMSGEEKAPVVLLLFLIAGVLGILLFFKSFNSVDYPAWLILPSAIVFCWTIWYSFSYYKKWFLILLSAAILVCAFVAWMQWDILREQMIHVKSSLQGEAELENMQVTLLALLFTVVLSFLLFTIEYLMKSHGLIYLFITLLLLLSSFINIHVNVETVFLLVLFQLAFWTIHLTQGHSTKVRSSVFLRTRLAGKSGIVMSFIFTISFAVVLSLVMIFSQHLYDSVYGAEGYVYRSIQNLSGGANNLITGGKISQSNLYRTGTEHLIVASDLQPTETLYLRGFSGGEYTGGDWTRSSDEEVLEKVVRDADDWKSSLASGWQPGEVSIFYHQMYVAMNVLSGAAEEVSLLTLQHSNGEYNMENIYSPYYGAYLNSNLSDDTAKEDKYYEYYYFEQKDMQIDWEYDLETYFERLGVTANDFTSVNYILQMEEDRRLYRKLQTDYMAQIGEFYTQVPTEILPRLTALVEENPLTDLDEITAFILYTLHSNASYSMTPGGAPLNQDIVEYFLFERKEGFCEHFAAAATLMYRLYGIPARYVTGYKVEPSDFKEQKFSDILGTLVTQAVVTDEAAHAWVEIFLEDYGWTPIEVTPSSNGATVVSYPGFDKSKLEQIWEEKDWDVSIPSLTVRNNTTDSSEIKKGENSDFLINIKINWEKYRDLGLVLITCLCYSILLLPLLLDYRRLQLQRKMDTWDCRAVFHRLMEALHFSGLLLEYTGSEPDFAEQFAQAVPVISGEEAEKMAAIVSKAAFGPEKPDIKEDEFVRFIYRCTVRSIYAELTRPKKIVFRFIKAFG